MQDPKAARGFFQRGRDPFLQVFLLAAATSFHSRSRLLPHLFLNDSLSAIAHAISSAGATGLRQQHPSLCTTEQRKLVRSDMLRLVR
jgi:hypothetical protein